MEYTAQGSGGVTIPESAKNTCGYGIWGHGFVVNMVVVLGWQLNVKIVKIFFNLSNSIKHLIQYGLPRFKKSYMKTLIVLQRTAHDSMT